MFDLQHKLTDWQTEKIDWFKNDKSTDQFE